MTATLGQLVRVRSHLAEDVLRFLHQFAAALDLTHWYRNNERIHARDIAIEQFVYTTRKRPTRRDDERNGRESLIEKQSPMEEIEAARYELPVNVDEREEVRWRQVVQRGRARLGLKGAPGSGKTFTTRHTLATFALAEATKLEDRLLDVDQVEAPLWVTAKALADTGANNLEDALPAALENSLNLKLSPRVREWLQRAIRASRFLIVVDALDELQSADRAGFAAQAKRLDESNARVIVTCRTMHWEERRAWLDWSSRLEEVELAPFKRRQQREFAQKFLGDKPALAQGMERLLQVNYALRHACTTPLLLTFACLLHEAGSVKENTTYAQLYAEITRKLFCGEWRDLKAFKPDWVGSGVKEERCLHFLEGIAWGLFVQAPELNRFTLGAWEQAADKALPDGRRGPLDSGDLLEQLERVGFIVPAGVDEQRRDRCWSFVHRTFLEFLAARALSRMEQTVWLAEAKEHFWFAPEWMEVLTFLAGLVDDATQLIDAVSQEEDDIFGSMLYLRAKFCGATNRLDVRVLNKVCDQVYTFWRETLYGWKDCLIDFANLKWVVLPTVKSDKTVLSKLLADLRDNDEYVRGHAAEVLRKMGENQAELVEGLLTALNDDFEPVRWRAANALGQLGEAQEKVVKGLLTALYDDSESVRECAVEALGEMGVEGEAVIAGMISVLHDECESVRKCAAGVLGQLVEARAAVATSLLEALGKGDWNIRMYSAEALGHIGVVTDEVIEGLLLALSDDVGYVRGCAAVALGQIGATQENVCVGLMSLLFDTEWFIRKRAAKALGQLGEGSVRVIKGLLITLRDDYEAVCGCAAEALGVLGVTTEEVIAGLQTALLDKRWYVRKSAAEAIGELGATTPEVVEKLLSLLQDADWRVRSSVVEALGKLGTATPGVVEKLLSLLQDADWRVRSSVVEALGKLGTATPGVVVELLEALRDVDWYVRKRVVEALGQLGATREEVIGGLQAVLRIRNGYMRSRIIDFLVQTREVPEEVVVRLLVLLSDTDEDVRRSVTEQLRQIGEVGEVIIVGLQVESRYDTFIRNSAARALSKLSNKSRRKVTRIM